MGRLDGKVAVILGASGENGMGWATAIRFAEEGAKLFIGARRMEALEKLAALTGATPFACDIRDDAQVGAIADAAVAQHGKLDAAVNFAGVDHPNPIAKLTPENLKDTIDTQFTGAIMFIKHMARAIGEDGSIVTAASLLATLPSPNYAAYGGTKAGITHVVRIAAVEYGPQRIKVNVITPGFVPTPMTAPYLDMKGVPEGHRRETPLGRLGTVQDLANAALWLASDESFISGENLQINGGAAIRRLPMPDEMMAISAELD